MSENKKRTMKVYYGHHSRSFSKHPVIRLGGKYLSNMDFKIGDAIEITTEFGRISIVKIPRE